MGRHCGFYFYKLVDDKLEDAKVVHEWCDKNEEMTSCLNIDGRCEATKIFLSAILEKEPKRDFFGIEIKPDDKYRAYLLMNHPELDGLEKREDGNEWFIKFFYLGLDEFKEIFPFDVAYANNEELIQNRRDEIVELKEEINSIRTHQENARTKAAFDGFERTIKELKEQIEYRKCDIKDLEEDYDIEHYRTIETYLEMVEEIIKEDPNIIVVAYAND